jgi:hypothetical protein
MSHPEQASLLGDPEPIIEGRHLTRLQAAAWQLLQTDPAGFTTDELGAALHPHGPERRCRWCAPTGSRLLRSKALRPLVTYRRDDYRGRVYMPRDLHLRPQPEGDPYQLRGLPGETFEDIFR